MNPRGIGPSRHPRASVENLGGNRHRSAGRCLCGETYEVIGTAGHCDDVMEAFWHKHDAHDEGWLAGFAYLMTDDVDLTESGRR